jgi:hypothetical protein
VLDLGQPYSFGASTSNDRPDRSKHAGLERNGWNRLVRRGRPLHFDSQVLGQLASCALGSPGLLGGMGYLSKICGYHTKIMNTTENSISLQTILRFPCIQLPLIIALYTKSYVGCVLGAQTYRSVAQYESSVWGTCRWPLCGTWLGFIIARYQEAPLVVVDWAFS